MARTAIVAASDTMSGFTPVCVPGSAGCVLPLGNTIVKRRVKGNSAGQFAEIAMFREDPRAKPRVPGDASWESTAIPGGKPLA